MGVPEFNPGLRQAWTVSAVLINMVGQGMVLSYPTTLLPGLEAPDSPIRTDIHIASWIASSSSLASIAGFFISSILMDISGRRIAHGLVLLPGIIGWLCIYFAGGITSLMIGRILTGITTGGTICLGAIVIGEYSNPKYRGMFLNLKTAAVYLGSMAVHTLGHFYAWRTIAIQSIVPLVIALIITYTWRESPAWLASKQRLVSSEQSFYWLQGKSELSRKELKALIEAQAIKKANRQKSTLLEKIVGVFKKFTKKDFLMPLMLCVVGTILLEVCGRHVFPAYALQIIGEITGTKSESFYYTLCIDAIITASTIYSSILVKSMKRRTLLFSTGFIAFFVLMAVCTLLYLMSKDIIPTGYSWVAIALFVLYFILANLGCTPIPLALLGELYPLEHRGTGSIVSGIAISLSAMGAIKVTPYLMISIKVYGTFAVYGIIMGISLLILYFTLPETKDKTLQEIEDYFMCGKFVDMSNKADEDAEVTIKMIK